jgi:hypothetical protein
MSQKTQTPSSINPKDRFNLNGDDAMLQFERLYLKYHGVKLKPTFATNRSISKNND